MTMVLFDSFISLTSYIRKLYICTYVVENNETYYFPCYLIYLLLNI